MQLKVVVAIFAVVAVVAVAVEEVEAVEKVVEVGKTIVDVAVLPNDSSIIYFDQTTVTTYLPICICQKYYFYKSMPNTAQLQLLDL